MRGVPPKNQNNELKVAETLHRSEENWKVKKDRLVILVLSDTFHACRHLINCPDRNIEYQLEMLHTFWVLFQMENKTTSHPQCFEAVLLALPSQTTRLFPLSSEQQLPPTQDKMWFLCVPSSTMEKWKQIETVPGCQPDCQPLRPQESLCLVADKTAKWKWSLYGTHLNADGVIFLWPWHCAIDIIFIISS